MRLFAPVIPEWITIRALAWLFGQLHGWPPHFAVLQTYLVTPPSNHTGRRFIPYYWRAVMKRAKFQVHLSADGGCIVIRQKNKKIAIPVKKGVQLIDLIEDGLASNLPRC